MNARRVLVVVATVATVALAACARDVVPTMTLSVALGDGRTCRDASVTTISLQGSDPDPSTFVCFDAEAPHAVTAVDLYLTDDTTIDGLSAEGNPLYRGHFVPADVIATPAPVVLYPFLAR